MGAASLTKEATREELMAYHHLFTLEHNRMAAEKLELDMYKQPAVELSQWRQALSNHSITPAAKGHMRHSRVHHLHDDERRELSKSLESSFMTVDSPGNIMPKTPKAP
jgi:hypothetical protein